MQSLATNESHKIRFVSRLIVAFALMVAPCGAQTDTNSPASFRAWNLKSGTNLVCRVTGFSQDGKSALIVLTNRIRASLPLTYLTSDDRDLLLKYKATLDLAAQAKDLSAHGYIEVTVDQIKAYEPNWPAFQGFWMDAKFSGIESPLSGEDALQNVRFAVEDTNGEHYFDFLAAKSESTFDDTFGNSGTHTQHKMDDQIMLLHRGDKFRLVGTRWPGHALYVDQIVLLKAESSDNPAKSDRP
jgi:hypothetical protein